MCTGKPSRIRIDCLQALALSLLLNWLNADPLDVVNFIICLPKKKPLQRPLVVKLKDISKIYHKCKENLSNTQFGFRNYLTWSKTTMSYFKVDVLACLNVCEKANYQKKRYNLTN